MTDKLIVAAGKGKLESVQVLIRAGAGIDLTSEVMMGEGNELACVLYNNLPNGTLITMICRLICLMKPEKRRYT